MRSGALAWRAAWQLVLPILAALAAASALGAALDTGALPLQLASIGWLLVWLLGSAWLAMAGLATWRAAAPGGSEGHSLAWRLALRGLTLLVALPWLARLVLEAAPLAAERLRLALGHDPAGQVQLLPSTDGRRLRLQGPIGQADARRVLAQMAAQPQLQLLELQAGGTRLAEAGRIAQAVRQRGLQTRVIGACDNACVMPWLAGSTRQVTATGRLGLHRPPVHALDPLGASLVRRGWAQAWRKAGLPADFARPALRTPPGMLWSPDPAQLQASGLLDVPGWPLDVPLPAGPALTQPDLAEALRSHRLWRAMELRFPGSIALAAERMAAQQAQTVHTAADQGALQVAAQGVVQAVLPALLSAADTGLHEQFITLLGEQLAAAQAAGGERCTQLLQADAGTRRALPAPLREREAAWLDDALATAPQPLPAHSRGDLEREVLRRSLGERAPALLAALWGPGRSWGPDPGCQRAARLLAAVGQLPAGERKLAARLMFRPR